MKLDGFAMGARRRSHLAGALTLAVTALAVAGCGGGSKTTTTSAAAPATTPAATATATTPAATATATTPAATTTTPATTATTPAATTPTTTTTTAARLKPASVSRGKTVFGTSCRGCHTLADTGPGGTIGPNLDQLRPADATVVAQVTNGGGAMPSFAGTLTRQQIVDVARYVSTVAGRRKK